MGIMRKTFITLCQTILWTIVFTACVADPGVAKRSGRVTDFSLKTTTIGCGKAYLMWAQLDTCSSNACPVGSHIASTSEYNTALAYIDLIINSQPSGATSTTTSSTTTQSSTTGNASAAPNGQVPAGGTVDKALLDAIKASAGICLTDIPTPRPTRQVFISTDFCSCINGKSDIINDCATACANYPNSARPTLYVNTTMGPDIELNESLKNLYGWCNNTIKGDITNPQCVLTAWDGTNTISNIPITLNANSNSFSADLTQLSLNKTYIMKLVEIKTGSMAESVEFQIRRTPPQTPATGQQGALKIAPISQYSCINYTGLINTSTGEMQRQIYNRFYYNYPANEAPPPMPPLLPGQPLKQVCHDEVLNPGNDSILYPRLELIPQMFAMWDKSDQRFATEQGAVAPKINTIIQARLYSEYNMTATLDLFKLIRWFNRPSSSASGSSSGSNTATLPSLGFIMIPWIDPLSGKTMCPTRNDFLTSTDPIFRVLRDYIDSTEALYIAEKEPELDLSGNYVYANMFINEAVVKKYSFYVENGLKVRADQAALNSKTIYFYWPVNNSMDPLQQGDRKLFTIKYSDALYGNQPTTISAGATTDKRLGCVPTTPIL